MFGHKKKIFVSCCSNRNPEWGMLLTLQEAIRATAKKGNDLVFKPRLEESLICRARQNDLVEFRQRGFDFLFSVDDDVFLTPDTIISLIEADKDVIAGIYRLGQDQPVSAVRIPPGGPSWQDVFQKNLLTPATYVSTGCMMIRRNVIDGMIEQLHILAHSVHDLVKNGRHNKNYSDEQFIKDVKKAILADVEYKRNVTGDICWALYQPFIHKEEYLSEDWAFCQRAKDAGFEIWVHGGVKCGHMKKKLYQFGE